jgi:excisionase family DNA binding protein
VNLIDTFGYFFYPESMSGIKPDQVYTTEEARNFLKISESTIKRHLKKGILKANKIGGRYRILGRELIRIVSPEAEKKAVLTYRNLKNRAKNKIERW